MAEGEGSWWERGRSLSRRKGRSLGGRRGGLIVDKRQKEAFMAFFFFFSLSPLLRTESKLCYNSNFTTVHTETLKFSFNPVGECGARNHEPLGAVGRSRWSVDGKWVQGEF